MDDSAGNGQAVDHLERAKAAASQGDALGMIEALARSNFLDGLKRRLQARWVALPPDEVDQCVATAVDEVFAQVATGKRARDLGALLFKVAERRAADRWRDDYSLRRKDAGEDGVEASVPEDAQTREARDAEAERQLVAAVRLARTLLPSLGHGQIVSVMEVVIDAAAQGVSDLSAAEVAETVGIAPASARKLMSRGLQRLRERVEKDGFEAFEGLMTTSNGSEDFDDVEA